MTKTRRSLLWLRERFAWMGQHSGYDQICDAMVKQWHGQHQSVWRERERLSQIGCRLFGPMLSKANASPLYDASSAAAELHAMWRCLRQRCDLIHVVYAEENLGFLTQWGQLFSTPIIGTVHQPSQWWRKMSCHPLSISSLVRLIVLSSRDLAYFGQYLPGRVHFIPHGVDTEFFHPQAGRGKSVSEGSYPRCVFCGTWLRDLDTLARVVDKVLVQDSGIRFDMIVPMARRDNPCFDRIARHREVSWHAGVSDEQLRDLYRRASLLVLPLLDCAANNALLEATSCGLPIVSNHIGGVPDYTRPSFADLLPVGDVDGFVEMILRLVNDSQECRLRGLAARSFAEQYLGWDRIAAQTLRIYDKVLASE